MRKLLLAALALGAATDAGASCGSAFCMINTNWSVQGQSTEPGARFDLLQTPLNSHNDFKPGTRTSVDLGYRKNLGDKLGLMLQRNFLHKARDSGSDAEPEDSGGQFLFLSPGVSYMLTQRLQAYGFVQLPLYQYVNGVQLTADWAVAAGVSLRF